MSYRRAGFSLIELLSVLTVVGILASLAAPSMTAQVERTRMRSSLDLLAAHLSRARVLAVRAGVRLEVHFRPNHGCASAYVVSRAHDGMTLDSVALPDAGRVCLSSNVRQKMVIDSRGMLVGSPRMIYARAGARADSISVSIAGRVYRWY
jgi:type IV fimbrial biogenesis protein FimT